MVPVVAVDEERSPTCHFARKKPRRVAHKGTRPRGDEARLPWEPTREFSRTNRRLVNRPTHGSRLRADKSPEPCIASLGVLTDGASPQELDQALRMARTVVNAFARTDYRPSPSVVRLPS